MQSHPQEDLVTSQKESRKKQKNNPSYLGTYLTLPLMIQAFELTPQLFPIPALPLHKQTP